MAEREENSLGDVLDRLEEAGREDAVSVGDVLDAFQDRSLGVLITVFGLIASIPIIGAIPGMSVLTGALVLIAVGQSMAGGRALWAPAAVRRREMDDGKFRAGLEKVRPWTDRVDRVLKPRLTFLTSGPPQRWLIAVCAALLAITFFPLAFVPWGVTAPAFGVVAFGLGLIARDGLMALIGYALSAVTVYLLVAFV